MDMTFKQIKEYGFEFPQARMWNTPENRRRIAQDAALITTPNTLVPVEFTAYIDPMVVEILTAPRNARRLYTEEKKGDWTTSYEKFRVSEMVGGTEEYSDYANGVTSDVNTEWMSRKQYIFQTTITYGDREMDMAAAGRLNLAADKQRAAATKIEIDSNKYYLLGVENQEIYGVLNDPNLPDAITASEGTESGNILWSEKTTKEIYDDVLKLFGQLVSQSSGLIDASSRLILAMSPTMITRLGSATDFNINVKKMLDSYFTQLEIVPIPELASLDGEETLMMIAPDVAGQKTGTLAYGLKMRMGRVIPDMSSFRQKVVASTYGGIIYQPFAVATMTGVA